MVGFVIQEKNTTKIKPLFAVDKHKEILRCDNYCPQKLKETQTFVIHCP